MERVAACLLVALAACPAPFPDACRVDEDCGGAVCTRVGVCSDAPYALRIAWTVAGAPADVATCDGAGIGELEIAIEAPDLGERHALRPVPCPTGSFFFDKLPPDFRLVRVTAYSRGGQFLTSIAADAGAGAGMVTVDLSPRARAAP